MIKKPANKLNEEAKQIKSLLSDFKKIRTKCMDLAAQLKVQLPKDALYTNVERTTLMKLELLDLAGIVNLKNSLVKILGQLFDQERELLYRKQKQQSQSKMENQKRAALLQTRKNNIQKAKEAAIAARSESMIDIYRQNSLDSMRTSRTTTMRQSKSIEIPIYKARAQTTQEKMDRISKYIASLKKNMKCNSDAAGSKRRIREYLLEQPTYLKAKTLLERYLMREQELQRLISMAVRDKLRDYFDKQPKIGQTEDYFLLKVDKPKGKQEQKNAGESPVAKKKSSLQRNMRRQVASPFKKSTRHETSAIGKQAIADFEEIKTQIEKKSQNYVEMFNKMSEVVERGSERLIQIRQKRKEALQDDDLWDQL